MTGTDYERNSRFQKMYDIPGRKPEISGTAGILCRDIEEKQLKDAALWARFVNEFRTRTDPDNGGWRGEYWGKMMRGAVTVYQYTQSPELYRVLEGSVRDLLTTEDACGRISTHSADREFGGWDMWCRKYVLLGLEFFLEICTDGELEKQIIASLCRQCDRICSKIGDGKLCITSTSPSWGGMNASSILEPLVRLYRLCGRQEYLDLARHIISAGGSAWGNIFEQAYEDKKFPYEYGVSKAYEMMSCFEGLLEYYYLTGEEKARETVLRFAKKVRQSDVTVIGSCGCTHELFDHSYLRQTADVSDTAIMQETCVSVTWLKLCEKLLRLTGEKCWADEAEKTFYNSYLGAYNPEFLPARDLTARLEAAEFSFTPLLFDSYSPLTAGTRGRKTGGFQILSDRGYFGCCACIAAAGAGIFAASQVLGTPEGIAVAGFEDGFYPFTTPAGQKASVRISGGYPYSDGKVTLTLSLPAAESFEILVRRPGDGFARLYALGKEATAQGFIPAEGLWKDGDVLTLVTDTSLKLINAPQYEKVTTCNYIRRTDTYEINEFVQTEREKRKLCLTRGPLVLALEEGSSCPDITVPVKPEVNSNPSAAVHDGIHRLAVDVPLDGGTSLRFFDYASSGLDWKARICAWFDGK